MTENDYASAQIEVYPGLRRGTGSAVLNAKTPEGEIIEELSYLEKNLSRLENAVENLQLKTIKICRMSEECEVDGKPVQGRNSEIGNTLRDRNEKLRHLTYSIESLIDRIEL